jgi:hypothetical protein
MASPLIGVLLFTPVAAISATAGSTIPMLVALLLMVPLLALLLTDSERAGVLEVACGGGWLVRKELELVVVHRRPGLSSVEPAESRVILRSGSVLDARACEDYHAVCGTTVAGGVRVALNRTRPSVVAGGRGGRSFPLGVLGLLVVITASVPGRRECSSVYWLPWDCPSWLACTVAYVEGDGGHLPVAIRTCAHPVSSRSR